MAPYGLLRQLRTYAMRSLTFRWGVNYPEKKRVVKIQAKEKIYG